jgi:hypothetical protein
VSAANISFRGVFVLKAFKRTAMMLGQQLIMLGLLEDAEANSNSALRSNQKLLVSRYENQSSRADCKYHSLPTYSSVRYLMLAQESEKLGAKICPKVWLFGNSF